MYKLLQILLQTFDSIYQPFTEHNLDPSSGFHQILGVDSNDPETGTSSPTTARLHTIQVKEFTKKFNKLYHQFYWYDNVDQTLMDEVCGTHITMDLFDKITLGKQYQNRIASSMEK